MIKERQRRFFESVLRQFLSLLLIFLAVLTAGAGASFAQATAKETRYLAPDALNEFYAERNDRLLWLKGIGVFQPKVKKTLEVLQASWMHGLNPENYHVPKLKAMLDDPEMNRFEFDKLMSDAVIRYARDIGSVRGQRLSQEQKIWRMPMEPRDILERIALAYNPAEELRKLEPNGSLYKALQKELILLLNENDGNEKPVSLPPGLKPGDLHQNIPLLRKKLGVEGNSVVYDDTLASNVMKIQRRDALSADGVLTKETLAAINRAAESRILQIVVNMERLRGMEQERPARYVLVNIPSASLWAVDHNDIVLEMPVIIGKTGRPTYSFRADITGVRFNPNWTVPPTIKKEDFLPMLRQNPLALAERGIVMKYQGKVIDPEKVDWANVTEKGISNLSMTQKPGEDNPLGKVRVIMDNPYNIYLHDTNNPTLFDKEERAASSGCIRVSQPEKLADFILKENSGWTTDKMNKLIASGRMRDVPTDKPLPVYITYQTMWLDSEGNLIYGRDIYGRDAELGGIIKKKYGIPVPSGF
jgi:murein L,D-transpeptidase YcbB/YkuD